MNNDMDTIIGEFETVRDQTVYVFENIDNDLPATVTVTASGFDCHVRLTPENLSSLIASLSAIQDSYNQGNFVG